MINVKFWVWINDSPVKLKLRPGQSLRWHRAWDTDEGWSSTAEQWVYDADDGLIHRDCVDDGCDCDGRLTRSHSLVTAPWQVADNEVDGIRYPDWQIESADVYDQFAQAAGY